MKGQIGCRKIGPLLLWMFLACAFCLFSNTASAQLVQSAAIVDQNTSWLHPSAAEQVLLNELHLLQLDLPGLDGFEPLADALLLRGKLRQLLPVM